MNHVLVTGATGGLGGPVVTQLLAHGWRVGCVVRARAGESAASRLAAAGLVGAVPIEAEIGGKLGAIGQARWDLVIHCASDRSRFPVNEAAQRRLNVEGPLEVLHASRAPRFLHVSSAWVAGARAGRAFESEVDVGQSFHNTTEETLLEGEVGLRAAASAGGVDLRVVRPGWVVGNCDPLAAFGALVADLAWRSKHSRSPLRIPGIKNAKLPLAPRAWVAASVVALAEAREAENGTFHLVADAPTQDAFFSCLAERAGFPGLRVYTPRGRAARPPSRIESRAHAVLGPMFDYLANNLEFDTTETVRVLGPRGLAPHLLSGGPLLDLIDRLLER